MAAVIYDVTKVTTSKTDKGTALKSVRLMISGRSMWLALTADLPSAKLTTNDTKLSVDDTEFNASKYERLQCKNENGVYWKLVPKCAFGVAEN